MKVWRKEYTRTEELGATKKEMCSENLAYDRVVFKMVVKGAKFRQEHATE
jgi:hypothetical protein